MKKCPVCGMMVDEKISPYEYKGTKYYFHKPVHKEMFIKDPEKFLNQEPVGMKM